MNRLPKLFWIGLGLILAGLYLGFRVQFLNTSSLVWLVLSLILLLAELHSLTHFLGLLYGKLVDFKDEYTDPNIDRNLQFNVFVCVCGEPEEIVERTVSSARAAVDEYIDKVDPIYFPRIYVLNDGKAAGKRNWQAIEAACKRWRAHHVARDNNSGYKAGNLNNGFQIATSSDPQNTIDVVLDADMAPKRNMLWELAKPFVDEQIDYVQSPQRYANDDSSWVAQASGAHQIYFFEHVCPAKSKDNALFLCGTNFAIRRSALNAVGGMDERFITEDYATSIKLHAAGKKGVLKPDVLAIGLAPVNLKEYFNQQTRWAKGSFDTTWAFWKNLLGPAFTMRQKWHYFLSSTYYLIGVRDLLLILSPLPYLFWNQPLISGANDWYVLLIYLPFMLYTFVWYGFLFEHPMKSMILDLISFPVFVQAFLRSICRDKLGFVVTLKKYEYENPLRVYWVQLLTACLIWLGLVYAYTMDSLGLMISYFWAGIHGGVLLVGFWLVLSENVQLPRIEVNLELLLPRLVKRLSLSIAFASVIMLPFISIWEDSGLRRHFVATLDAVDSTQVIPESGVLYGYYLPHLDGHPERFSVSLHGDERPSLAMYYQDWSDFQRFDLAYMQRLSNKGVIPVVTWEPRGVTDMGGLAVSPETIIEGRYDAFIQNWARGAAEYGEPMFLRFAHDMNGNWYSWGMDRYEDDYSYIEMWRHVHTIFQEQGATNVIWIWSPGPTDIHGKSDTMDVFYPGDEYVDWVGFTALNWQGQPSESYLSFDDIADEAYRRVSKYEKPIMLTGVSTTSKGGNKRQWMELTLGVDIPNRSLVKGVVLYNENMGNADFSVGSGMDSHQFVEQMFLNNTFYLKGN